MATYNITTTAQDDTRLTYVLTRYNRQRTEAGQPTVTDAAFVQGFFRRTLDEEFDTQRRIEQDRLKNAWATATPEQQDQIRTILGL